MLLGQCFIGLYGLEVVSTCMALLAEYVLPRHMSISLSNYCFFDSNNVFVKEGRAMFVKQLLKSTSRDVTRVKGPVNDEEFFIVDFFFVVIFIFVVFFDSFLIF